MEALEFIAILTVFAVVLVWYIHNVQTDSEGERGLLAIAADPETAKPGAPQSSYRMKTRLAMRAHERRDAEGVKTAAQATPAYRVLDDGDRMRRKFRRQDESRYRAKDKTARYKPRNGPTAA